MVSILPTCFSLIFVLCVAIGIEGSLTVRVAGVMGFVAMTYSVKRVNAFWQEKRVTVGNN